MWDIFYGSFTLFVVGVSWLLSKRVSLTCSIALLLLWWFANFFYQENTIEEISTQLTGIMFIGVCFWLINKYHHWLPWVLAISTAATVVWTAVYNGDDPYMYKAVKNLIYFGELLAVCISWIPWMNTRNSLPT